MELYDLKYLLALSLLVCDNLKTVCEEEFIFPDVTIEALEPRGIRILIPDDPKNIYFVLQGKINSRITIGQPGDISVQILKPKNGIWMYRNENIKLNIGDVIYYFIYLIHDNKALIKNNLSHTVKEFANTVIPPATSCTPTLTLIRSGKACAYHILFEDNFDSLREDLWQIEQYIPGGPDYPFVSYQKPPIAQTVYVREGYLYIKPILQQDLPRTSSVYSGTLDLFSGCTATSNMCLAQASGATILPPVASGRLTSKSFAFTYGVIEVRAKLPQGDWLYPDILLESLMKKYGVLNYASGVLRIAGARGNSQLSAANREVGSKLLYGGPMMDVGCRTTLLGEKLSNTSWGDDFHVYSAKWEPDRITLFVDGEEWSRVALALNNLQGEFSSTCNLPREFLSRGSNIAPFDDHFFITLGLAAGGIIEFSDDQTSAGRPKPWRNTSRKASLRFWENLPFFYRTWTQPALVIDYVRVRAL